MTGGPSNDLDRYAGEELMHLVARGSTAAFEVVYDRHGAVAFSLALPGGRQPSGRGGT